MIVRVCQSRFQQVARTFCFWSCLCNECAVCVEQRNKSWKSCLLHLIYICCRSAVKYPTYSQYCETFSRLCLFVCSFFSSRWVWRSVSVESVVHEVEFVAVTGACVCVCVCALALARHLDLGWSSSNIRTCCDAVIEWWMVMQSQLNGWQMQISNWIVIIIIA